MVSQQTGEMLKQPSRGSFGASRVPLESSRYALSKSHVARRSLRWSRELRDDLSNIEPPSSLFVAPKEAFHASPRASEGRHGGACHSNCAPFARSWLWPAWPLARPRPRLTLLSQVDDLRRVPSALGLANEMDMYDDIHGAVLLSAGGEGGESPAAARVRVAAPELGARSSLTDSLLPVCGSGLCQDRVGSLLHVYVGPARCMAVLGACS